MERKDQNDMWDFRVEWVSKEGLPISSHGTIRLSKTRDASMRSLIKKFEPYASQMKVLYFDRSMSENEKVTNEDLNEE